MKARDGDAGDYFSSPMYKDLRDHNQVFDGVQAAMRTNLGVSWQDQTEDRDAELVSGNYFLVLRLKPALGRLFTSADETAKDANPVVVLSHYWRTRGELETEQLDLLLEALPHDHFDVTRSVASHYNRAVHPHVGFQVFICRAPRGHFERRRVRAAEQFSAKSTAFASGHLAARPDAD